MGGKGEIGEGRRVEWRGELRREGRADRSSFDVAGEWEGWIE